MNTNANQNENEKAVLITGTVAYDDIITPFKSGENILGGSASYIALACSYFAKAAIVSNVGNDFAKSDIERLESKGIDFSGVKIHSDEKTFHWKGKYLENFNERVTLETQLNCLEKLDPSLNEEQKNSDLLVLGNMSSFVQAKVRKSVKKDCFVILDTMNLWISLELENLKELIKTVDIFIVNEEEAQLLTGQSNCANAGRELFKNSGAKTVIVKKGEHGALLFHKDGMFLAPSYPVDDVQDPTGAGDSFAGALAGHLARKGDFSFKSIKEAMLWASSTASLTVEEFSCDKLEQTGYEQIRKRYDFLIELTKV